MADINERVASLETKLDMITVSMDKGFEEMKALLKGLPCAENSKTIAVLDTNQKWHRLGIVGGLSGLASIAWLAIKGLIHVS